MLYRVVVYGVFFYCLLFAELKLEDFRGMYHDEVGVITGRLELFVSLFVHLENTIELSFMIPAGIFGNYLDFNKRSSPIPSLNLCSATGNCL